MKVKKVAVITGDLINSRQIPIEKRQQVYDYMTRVYHSYANRRGWHNAAKLEFFRGDSFQLLVDEPEVALRVALFLRARLRAVCGRNDMQDVHNLSKHTRKSNSKKLWDARIAIGIGEVSHRSESVLNSDGEAFVLSGHTLDQMKRNEQLAIKIQGVDKSSMIQSQLDLLLRLGSGIVQDWTGAQSELAAEYIEYPNKTQVELEKEYGIPQNAISRRKSGGHIDEILSLCDYFEKLILTVL